VSSSSISARELFGFGKRHCRDLLNATRRLAKRHRPAPRVERARLAPLAPSDFVHEEDPAETIAVVEEGDERKRRFRSGWCRA
jgi:hypothetical protein